MGNYINNKDKVKITELCTAHKDELNIDNFVIANNKVEITIKDGNGLKAHARLLGLMDKLGFTAKYFNVIGKGVANSFEIYSAKHTFVKA